MTCQRWLWSSVVAVGMVATLSAQTPKPAFEVASVKRNLSTSFSSSQNVRPGGVFNAINVPLTQLIQFAFEVQRYQITGGPDWVRNDRFDVTAKPENEVARDRLRLMMQSLLQDRFKLTLRKDQRDMPMYALVLARNDGRLGSNLKRAADNCDTPEGRAAAATTEQALVAPRGGAVSGGSCLSMASLASGFARQLGMPVLDKTGLGGNWAYSLYYAPDAPLSADRPTNPDLPSLVSAMPEQLGLKLEATRGPVDVLVIDSVQQPTEN